MVVALGGVVVGKVLEWEVVVVVPVVEVLVVVGIMVVDKGEEIIVEVEALIVAVDAEVLSPVGLTKTFQVK